MNLKLTVVSGSSKRECTLSVLQNILQVLQSRQAAILACLNGPSN